MSSADSVDHHDRDEDADDVDRQAVIPKQAEVRSMRLPDTAGAKSPKIAALRTVDSQ
ncbi:MAG: hypothetical protein IPH65_17355 [Dehalococcoidia bacterium]|uniref:hypothetical protein n=1 Tax=Candidatus Amarobacter glycogenicus TaxID=3140699 RepID=UPI003136AAF2|nr:hypothetical protein [Dehalococcoidia bacterium]